MGIARKWTHFVTAAKTRILIVVVYCQFWSPNSNKLSHYQIVHSESTDGRKIRQEPSCSMPRDESICWQLSAHFTAATKIKRKSRRPFSPAKWMDMPRIFWKPLPLILAKRLMTSRRVKLRRKLSWEPNNFMNMTKKMNLIQVQIRTHMETNLKKRKK